MQRRMRSGRTSTWLGVAGAAVLLVAAVVVGVVQNLASTSTPLHPVAQDVSSVRRATPPFAWAETAERARQLVRAHVSAGNLPGVSVAVGVGEEIVWAEGFGWADLSTRTAVTPDTAFRLGTASIPLTSAAAGVLLERGQLRLDAEIQTYVPEFPRAAVPMTLQHLMAHTAGVPPDGGDEGPLFVMHCARPVEAIPGFVSWSRLFDPGTGFHVSAHGWVLVSAAIEAAAREPFLRVMRKEVFEPLGMDDTRADAPGSPDQATSYFPRFAADPRYGPEDMRPLDLSCYAGAGQFVSTPSDLVRFALGLSSGRLLRPATRARLLAGQRTTAGDATAYGLGWARTTVTLAGRPATAVGHDGHVLGGPAVSLLMVPERRLVVAVMANISYAEPAGLATALANTFAAGAPATPATP